MPPLTRMFSSSVSWRAHAVRNTDDGRAPESAS